MLRSIPGTSPVHLTLSLVSLPSSPSRLSFSLSPFPFRRAVNRSFLRSVLQTTTTTTSRRSKPDRLRSASLLTRISSGYLTDPHLRPHKGPGASSSSPVIIAQIDILGTSSCLSTVAQPSTHRTHLNHATRTRTTPPFRADSDNRWVSNHPPQPRQIQPPALTPALATQTPLLPSAAASSPWLSRARTPSE